MEVRSDVVGQKETKSVLPAATETDLSSGMHIVIELGTRGSNREDDRRDMTRRRAVGADREAVSFGAILAFPAVTPNGGKIAIL